MAEIETIDLRHGLFKVSYYRQGRGAPLVFFHDILGLQGFPAELQQLARRFDVTAPLHPGFGSTGEENLHEDVLKLTLYGWDLLDALGLERVALVGHGFGGMLAAEMAAIEPSRVQKLVLVAPAGLWLPEHPTEDIFAMNHAQLVAAAFHDAESAPAQALLAAPADRSAADEETIERARAMAAVARFLWPLGDRGLGERLYRVKAPTLLLWGSEDRLIPAAYAHAFAEKLEGAARTVTTIVPQAGHMLLAENTSAAVRAIAEFCA
jgi:pimeloyl-ACP methyl ester carboxylesterase